MFAFDICTQHHGGTISPKVLRDLADMGETGSEQVLSSNMLSAWAKKGIVRRLSKGKYRFVKNPATPDAYAELLDAFQIPPQTPEKAQPEEIDSSPELF
jgi:hypothetical protein